ncbi:MAG: hypothetical protein MK086_12655 [Flavobacteriales bacterium]|nr:hypothetical protein [Flavobacteriales bacterium]
MRTMCKKIGPFPRNRNYIYLPLLIGLMFIPVSEVWAQLDDLHYIPPLASETTSGDAPGGVYLYISTPSSSNVSFEITDAANT